MLRQIIKFVDYNADGCGTDIEMYVEVNGPELTNGVIERTKKAIEEYKNENPYEWDTNSVISIACEYLETEGYETDSLSESYTIVF